MPVAAWIIKECLLCWSSRWGSAEAEAVGLTLKDSILTNTEHETLNYQCYWLCTTLAIGGIMRVRSSFHLILSRHKRACQQGVMVLPGAWDTGGMQITLPLFAPPFLCITDWERS